jgi:hypothetical protein
MSAAIVKFRPKGSGSDPAYSAIEAHRAAIQNLTEASHISGRVDYGGPGGSPEYWHAQDRTKRSCEQLSAALSALLACRPATMAGLLALLDYVGQPEWLDDAKSRATILSGSYEYDEDVLDRAREFPRTIAAALRKMIEA